MSFHYTDDIIDSRDLYTRQCELEALEGALDDAQEEYEDAQTDVTLASHGDGDTTGELTERLNAALEALKEAQDEFAEPEKDELKMLRSLENEIDDYMHGTTLIREEYFETYAKEYASDVCEMPRRSELRWPFTCIDWKEAAEELQSDFNQVEIDGTTYYFS